jgi:hypothetical protein
MNSGVFCPSGEEVRDKTNNKEASSTVFRACLKLPLIIAIALLPPPSFMYVFFRTYFSPFFAIIDNHPPCVNFSIRFNFLFYYPSAHKPERIWSEDYDYNKNPYDVPYSKG